LPLKFGIVDLFAGPGGLGEGFTSLSEGTHKPFQIGISVEKETSAHQTLKLRSFLRDYRVRHRVLPKQFIEFHAGRTAEPDWNSVDAKSWLQATKEAKCLELGTTSATEAIDTAIARLRREFNDTILIGGPPCQAYSLVGRSRAKGKLGYIPEDDNRHYLFREYIRVLDRLRPAVFVMENVKGMLSSKVESRLVFEMLMEDLSTLGRKRGGLYELRAVRLQNGVATLVEATHASDFIMRAENFGVPQRRHRVIIIGIRSDVAAGIPKARVMVPTRTRTVDDAIGDLPALRSGLSRGNDSVEEWTSTVRQAAQVLLRLHRRKQDHDIHAALEELTIRMDSSGSLERTSASRRSGYGRSNDDLKKWLEVPELKAIAQHETRGHMATDLGRYIFCAVLGKINGSSPKADQFPIALSPDHRNWNSGDFSDRFRVQLANEPATTVTSHISKDGHYFIHPDPVQCRSLTVREAARLQTFPDDYLFLGNRTQQYVQVGNAVPPLLAREVARLIYMVLSNQSKKHSHG
jgi:DNA (cytosine-5)-methyltransferase 1